MEREKRIRVSRAVVIGLFAVVLGLKAYGVLALRHRVVTVQPGSYRSLALNPWRSESFRVYRDGTPTGDWSIEVRSPGSFNIDRTSEFRLTGNDARQELYFESSDATVLTATGNCTSTLVIEINPELAETPGWLW